MEPTSTQVERAAGALVPFVREWNLSLNPEDLAELAYAVLLHHDSEATWDEIDAAVRAQIEDHRRRAEGLDKAMREARPELTTQATIHFDGGGLSPGPVTAACTVELSDGTHYEHVRRFDQGTHNTAEWHALILGLRVALKHGERHVVVKGDSLLVVKQINREWKTTNAALLALRAQAEELLALFETWSVEWIPRKENRRADELGRAG
jgi:ribonuclease HI